MKIRTKQISSLMGAFAMLFIVACKKDYDCECVTTITSPAYTLNNQVYPEEVTTETYTVSLRTEKKNAEAECNKEESTISILSPLAAVGIAQGPIVQVTTCELK